MLNSGGVVTGLAAVLAAHLAACEPYCPKGYEKKGDTCYRLRDSGVEGGLPDGETPSEAVDGGAQGSSADGAAAAEDRHGDGAMDEGEEDSCSDAASAADCGERAAGDACEADTCEHGGACLDAAGVVSCDCGGTGYEGDTCGDDIDECAAPNTCASPDYPCVQTEPPGYTCEGQLADWPMPDSVPGAKVMPSYDLTTNPELVTDVITGLVWQRNLPATYTGCTGMEQVAGDTCTWQQAKDYCSALVLAGRTDWRLPTKVELESIVDDTRPGLPAYDSRVFPGAPATPSRGSAWTASRFVGSADQVTAFVIGNDGATWGAPSAASSATKAGLGVRCVRSRRVPSGMPSRRYENGILGIATVTDLRTGLTWQRDILSEMFTFNGAAAYCRGFGEGWRLPTKKELLTMIDPARVNAGGAVDVAVFPGASGGEMFGSSSPVVPGEASGASAYWRVVVGNGVTVPWRGEDVARVRCVR